jgi:hypothetical protein
MKMKIFKKHTTEVDNLERMLDTISDLTRGLGRTEFNNLIEAIKSVYEARQKLRKVKTDEEKENADIAEAEKSFEYEVTK